MQARPGAQARSPGDGNGDFENELKTGKILRRGAVDFFKKWNVVKCPETGLGVCIKWLQKVWARPGAQAGSPGDGNGDFENEPKTGKILRRGAVDFFKN